MILELPPLIRYTCFSNFSDGSLVSWDSDRWNKCDWVEIDPCKTAIEQAHQDLGDFLYDQHPPLKKFW